MTDLPHSSSESAAAEAAAAMSGAPPESAAVPMDSPPTIADLPEPVSADPEPVTPSVGSASEGPSAGLLDERPEIAVGGALAGGFLLAQILKRLGR